MRLNGDRKCDFNQTERGLSNGVLTPRQQGVNHSKRNAMVISVLAFGGGGVNKSVNFSDFSVMVQKCEMKESRAASLSK